MGAASGTVRTAWYTGDPRPGRRRGWSVAELLMPIGGAALAGEVEQVPQRLDSADVAGFLPGFDGCVKEFRAPEVADRLPVAVKHVQHGLLRAVGGLGEVVAVVGGAGRGQRAQPPPAAFGGQSEAAR